MHAKVPTGSKQANVFNLMHARAPTGSKQASVFNLMHAKAPTGSKQASVFNLMHARAPTGSKQASVAGSIAQKYFKWTSKQSKRKPIERSTLNKVSGKRFWHPLNYSTWMTEKTTQPFVSIQSQAKISVELGELQFQSTVQTTTTLTGHEHTPNKFTFSRSFFFFFLISLFFRKVEIQFWWVVTRFTGTVSSLIWTFEICRFFHRNLVWYFWKQILHAEGVN